MKRVILIFVLTAGTGMPAHSEDRISENTEICGGISETVTDRKENGRVEYHPNTVLYGKTSLFGKTSFQQRNQYRIPSRDDGYQDDFIETPRGRRGYIGFGIGGAIAIADAEYNSEKGTGGQATINFGYLFSRRVGIAASLLLTNYAYDYYYGTSGLITGPLFSFGRTGGIFSFDLRPGVGLARAVDRWDDDRYPIYDMGGSFRWGLGRFMSITVNMDCYVGPGTPTLGLSLGLNYRLR
jgi:hypothetical protein